MIILIMDFWLDTGLEISSATLFLSIDNNYSYSVYTQMGNTCIYDFNLLWTS